MSWAELGAFAIYLIFMLAIGIYLFLHSKDADDKDFFLGGRAMNSWVTALSAQASDMSAWLLMGLPGSILAFGVGKVWIAVGLLIGTILNWILTAPRLRVFSQAAGDAITVPQYLTNRFKSRSKALQVVCAIVFLVCYVIYAASSFKACGSLFSTVFGINATVAVTISAAIILVYTFLGGFSAACWTDFFQGMLMLVALLIAPIAAWKAVQAGNVVMQEGVEAVAIPENYWNLLPSGKLDWVSISDILSGLAWGLGYFGMPHIIVRFMAIKEPSMIKKSRIIAIVWVVIALIAAVAMALIGRLYLPTLQDGDRTLVFIQMVRNLFPAFIAGILLSAILAASMSTADSQLLVAASAFTSDVYKPIIRKKASNEETVWVGRIVVLVITIAAYIIAIDPNSGDIMDLVENAWGGFGSAFGPVILLSLFWKRFTYKGALAGIVGGAAMDIFWLVKLTTPTGLYELLPGFIFGMLCAIVVTKLDSENNRVEASKIFDELMKSAN